MGGEKKSSRCCTSIGLGSPPHRRGKVRPSSKTATPTRITPAWAGKRLLLLEFLLLYRDHPRMGGEKPPIHSWLSVGTGITPAWAGKRRCTRLDAGHRRDHPRVGGEKIKSGGPLDTARGSPPRGRGKAEQQAYEQLQSGITPAQAGKSRPSPASEMPTKDYPRVGGEKIRQSIWYRTT